MAPPLPAEQRPSRAYEKKWTLEISVANRDYVED